MFALRELVKRTAKMRSDDARTMLKKALLTTRKLTDFFGTSRKVSIFPIIATG